MVKKRNPKMKGEGEGRRKGLEFDSSHNKKINN